MSHKNILIDLNPMVSQQKSGVGYYVTGLITSLSKAKPEEIAIKGYYFSFLRFTKEDIIKLKGITYLPIRLIPGKILSICRRMGFQPFIDFFKLTRADIIIYTNYVSLPTIFKHRKVVVIVYDLSFYDSPEYIQSKNLAYLTRFCPPSIKKADIIITISEFTKSRIQQHFPDLKAPILITPIPPIGLIRSPVKENKRLDGLGIIPGKYILFLGTIEPRKNLQNLMYAYISLRKDLRETFSLVLAGGRGWKDEQIIQDIKTHQDNGFSIITPGYITDEEKAYLYQNANCFILPSHYEGFGMPLLEAMQYKVPVAVSDIEVFREVAGDAALYFIKDSPADITREISTLLTNSEVRAKLIYKGLKRLNQFNWEDNAKKVLGAIEQIDTKD